MKILHINYSDTNGSRFNGFSLMEFNSNSSIDISMAVWKKESNNLTVYLLPPKNHFFKILIEKFNHLLAKLGFGHIISFYGFYMLKRQKYYKEADIIHLHIIHGDTNIGIFDIPKLCKNKKIVWTIHDQWALSGGCIHPFSCNGISVGCSKKCPFPRYKSGFNKLSPFFHFKIKKKVYDQSQFHIIVSTEWMKTKIENSILMKKRDISVIPFGIDTDVFKNQGKKSSRSLVNIPQDHFVIALRYLGENDTMKGFKYSREALESLSIERNITIIIFEQKGGLSGLSNKYNIIETGWIPQAELIKYLSASDLLIMPSLQESFGLMAIEAMACEVPVIVAESTALPEVVENKIGGIVVKQCNSKEIEEAITLLINNREYHEALSKKAREKVIRKYNICNYVQAHEKLYSSIIQRL